MIYVRITRLFIRFQHLKMKRGVLLILHLTLLARIYIFFSYSLILK